jgi:5-formyltetrahydrofolate cyclo-ligase
MNPNLPRLGDPVAEAKHELRQNMREARDRLSIEEATRACAQATAYVLSVQPLLAAPLIALYAAMGSEMATVELARALRARGATLAYPRVVKGNRRLAFHRVDDLSDLVVGHFGVPEPPINAPSVLLERIDAFIVPGLAFDESGNRLGWGKGHYDSSLAANDRALRIGFAFECQITERVPTEATDARMDLVITEGGVRNCGRGTP